MSIAKKIFLLFKLQTLKKSHQVQNIIWKIVFLGLTVIFNQIRQKTKEKYFLHSQIEHFKTHNLRMFNKMYNRQQNNLSTFKNICDFSLI